jgi:hypothetical protein
MHHNTRDLLSDVKFYESYSRYNEILGRYETWDEAVDRVMSMHNNYYADKMNDELSEYINKSTKAYKEKRVLGAQRALQFGGDQLLRKHMRIFNCFDVNTKFVTSEGIKSFSDFEENDEIVVLTHKGNWKKAKVKSYGKQELYEIVLSKTNHTRSVFATKNHRWLLNDGKETTNLKVSDIIMKKENTFNDFSWDNSSIEEQLYWCYGFVYGDGTVNNNHSMVRLCGKDKNYEYRFLNLGFKSSTSLSLEGDVIVYTGKYQKTLPDPNKDSPELIRAFCRGYLDASGEKIETRFDFDKFKSIQTSNEESINFIREIFPIAGIDIISEQDCTNQETNFGIRKNKTIRFRICHTNNTYSAYWKVSDIKYYKTDTVWCLEVEDDKSFVLDGGIITGNCTSSHVDRPEFFGEFFWILLCGAGAGFSIQKHHIKKLPKVKSRTKQPKTHVVEDSIEGWATALDVLLSSYFEGGGKHPEYEGRRVYFDLSMIRPKGSMVSGNFKAPGPEPLRKSLDKIEYLLQGIVLDEKSRKLKSIEIYDICMHTADAVLAGGVRRSACCALFSPDDQDMINAKTGNWFQENPQRARSNNSAVIKRDEVDKEFFLSIMDKIKQFGEPGFFFVDDLDVTTNPCFEIGMYPKTAKGKSGWQACVSGDTKLITRNGVVSIGNALGEEIEIWNGEKWSKVIPIHTGSNREMYRVKFGDGSYLDCTNNHKFLVKHRFEKEYREFDTKSLIKEINKTKYVLSVPRYTIEYNEGKEEKNAYEYGFILGDGTANHWYSEKGTKINRTPFASVYENNWKYKFPITGTSGTILEASNGSKFYNHYFTSVDKEIAKTIKYIHGLPKMVFEWDRKSIKDFLAGWIDSDGTILSSGGFRIYGREDKIRDCQLLLSKIGINSSVNLCSKKGECTNKGIRNQDVWYVQVSDTKDLYCNKGELKSSEVKFKGKCQTIKSIEKLDGLFDSFCFEEKELNQAVFNNVLTKQCNLTEINGGMCNTEEDFYLACETASVIGTLQAGYTNFEFLSEASKEIIDREALLGVSITGWMNNPSILFDEKVLRKGAKIVLDTNKKIAKLIGINPAARATTVKPSGNASVLLKTASGIHPDHSKHFIRNIQVNKDSEVGQVIKEMNPYMVEESVWSAHNTDYIISFPIVSNDGSLFKDDLIGINHLELVRKAQQNWVEYGTNLETCLNKTVRHNVSNTIIVDDWDEVSEYIFKNRKYFAGIAFISMTGDKDYNQAPNTKVIFEDEIVKKYGAGSIFASGMIVDGIKVFDNLWDACHTAINEGKIDESEPTSVLKNDWIRRFNSFSQNYFDGDKKKTEYCLKDVYLFHKWNKIQQNFQEIDWTNDLKEKKFVDIDTMAAAACSGVNENGEESCFI